MRGGLEARGRARRDGGARQGRLGRARSSLWQRLEADGRAHAARLAVGAARPARASCARSAIRSGFGSRLLRLGYLKVFMDGTLGSQTAWMLDGSGVQITSGDELAEIVLRRRGGRVPGRGARDRRPREPRGARRVRAARARCGARSACASGSSMRSSSRPRTSCRASPRSASPRRCSSRTHRPTATSPTASGPARPTAPTRTARSWTRARSSRTGRTRRSRSSTRSRASARACGGRSTTASRGIRQQALTVQQAFEATSVTPAWLAGDERRRGKLLPGLRRRPRRARPRPVGRPRRAGRGDDGRRPVGAQPAAVGLTRPRRRRASEHRSA